MGNRVWGTSSAVPYNGGGAGTGKVTNGGPGTARDGSEWADETPCLVTSRDATGGAVCCLRVCNEYVTEISEMPNKIYGENHYTMTFHAVDEKSTNKPTIESRVGTKLPSVLSIPVKDVTQRKQTKPHFSLAYALEQSRLTTATTKTTIARRRSPLESWRYRATLLQR